MARNSRWWIAAGCAVLAILPLSALFAGDPETREERAIAWSGTLVLTSHKRVFAEDLAQGVAAVGPRMGGEPGLFAAVPALMQWKLVADLENLEEPIALQEIRGLPQAVFRILTADGDIYLYSQEQSTNELRYLGNAMGVFREDATTGKVLRPDSLAR